MLLRPTSSRARSRSFAGCVARAVGPAPDAGPTAGGHSAGGPPLPTGPPARSTQMRSVGLLGDPGTCSVTSRTYVLAHWRASGRRLSDGGLAHGRGAPGVGGRVGARDAFRSRSAVTGRASGPRQPPAANTCPRVPQPNAGTHLASPERSAPRAPPPGACPLSGPRPRPCPLSSGPPPVLLSEHPRCLSAPPRVHRPAPRLYTAPGGLSRRATRRRSECPQRGPGRSVGTPAPRPGPRGWGTAVGDVSGPRKGLPPCTAASVRRVLRDPPPSAAFC